ncbi:hypothetical protein [Stenotrophomonas sp.]|uniref:hypothetical protein n=1 Tax=Stenotrophomonas sp. TaxID=69392 RepID=UPI002FC8AD55
MAALYRRLLAWLRARTTSPPPPRAPGQADDAPAAPGPYSPALRHGEIATAAAFRARLTDDAVAHARIPLDPAKVPVALRALVPLAAYWGICDDAIREEMQEAESQADKQAMADAVNPHNAAITAWLDSWPPGQVMSDEAAAFMYMQLGLTELDLFALE